ncbi:predicted protein [Botrytis cinerea T4]|uniref:Uncharacterized protein n=1 Tax=Botryotinia fuckeliana (strain T4) TaxID=999810 RepID=G2XVA8_BOTF4|nr:predicted protein [Botrytis cinerea T4]
MGFFEKNLNVPITSIAFLALKGTKQALVFRAVIEGYKISLSESDDSLILDLADVYVSFGGAQP